MTIDDRAAGTEVKCIGCKEMINVPEKKAATPTAKTPADEPPDANRYGREKLTLLNWLAESPWFRPAVIILIIALGGGAMLYFVSDMMNTTKPAHSMTQQEFIEELRELVKQSPHAELRIVRKDAFRATFGIPDGEELLDATRYEDWFILSYRTKGSAVKLNLVKNPKLPDGQLGADWVKVWIPNRQADQLAKQELRDPRMHIRTRETEKFYQENKDAIDSAISAGDALTKAGKYKQAIASFAKAEGIMDNTPAREGNVGAALARIRNKTNEARKTWTEAVNASTTLLKNAAEHSYEQNQLDPAKKQYQAVIDYVRDSEIQTASMKTAAGSAQSRLMEIEKTQAEIARQAELARLAEAQRLAHEQKRQATVARLQTLAPSYQALQRLHVELTSPSDGHAAKIAKLNASLSAACETLDLHPDVKQYTLLLRSLDQASASIGAYATTLAGGETAATPKEASFARKLAAAERQKHLSHACGKLVSFVYEYSQAMKAMGEPFDIAPATLYECAVAEGVERTKCPNCLGKGDLACRDCRFNGRSTGKVICGTCLGKRLVQCKTCDGLHMIKCSSCNGKGKQYSGTAKDGPWIKKTYRTCSTCKGKKTTWGNLPYWGSQRGGPGKCPACVGHPGKMACSTCKGKGITGTCKKCAGKKRITCDSCKGSGKKDTTVVAAS